GGSLGRVKATGRGVYIAGREIARKLGMKIDGARVAVQGFGNVGSIAAELFAASGAKIVAVQDHTGTLYNEAGLDVAALQQTSAREGGIIGYKGGQKIDNENFWDVETDFLIPAALEGQISKARSERIKTKVILEGANGPTVPDADNVFAERGITVVPDVLANAGGVTVSYFEWVQDFSSFFWTEEEINVRLDKIMTNAFNQVWSTSEKHKITLRTAAYVVACERVLKARSERGLYP
ncbi:MAG: Glu/Leu/Phe/Val family dehydrogenase, partial [Burkholderiales bacterium]